MSKDKRIKDSNKKNRWENIFLIGSIFFIVLCVCFYGYRLIYYYTLEHPSREDKSLVSKIGSLEVVYSGDGLYSKDLKNFYYYGKEVNNYIVFNGILFRIIEINENGIKIISDESLTSLAYQNDSYDTSYVNMWLNNIQDYEHSGIFINSINNYQQYLVKSNYCVDKMELDNPTCNSLYSNYSGLLSVSDYIRAGGRDSYLNNNTYFWTSNSSIDGNLIYVFDDGGINDEDFKEGYYYSYGVRPVITLNSYLECISGDGSINNPYIIEKNDVNTTHDMFVGEYIKINDNTYRVMSKFDDSIKIIYNGVLSDKYNYGDANWIINNNIINNVDNDLLQKCDFYKGIYGNEGNYDYRNVYSDIDNNYIGFVSIGDMFLNSYNDYWLYNRLSDMYYRIYDYNKFILDDGVNTNNVRYAMCIKNDININDGDGSINNPYLIGD